MYDQLGVIGCGLMGGSFALALRHAGKVRRIVGHSASAATTARAVTLGVIDAPCASAAEAAAGSDLVLVAVPVAASEATFMAIRDALASGALAMDLGSTKSDVVAAARRGLGERIDSFVPAHPIAGKETAGVEHADAALYRGRWVVLTPLDVTPPALARRAAEAWTAVGAQVRSMTAERHDAALAAVSHLPHLLAFAYIDAIMGQPAGDEFLSLAGPGFRDFTRIAAAEPSIWRDILLANRDEVLRQSRQFREALDLYEQAVRDGDAAAIEALIRHASQARLRWQPGTAPPSASASAEAASPLAAATPSSPPR